MFWRNLLVLNLNYLYMAIYLRDHCNHVALDTVYACMVLIHEVLNSVSEVIVSYYVDAILEVQVLLVIGH